MESIRTTAQSLEQTHQELVTSMNSRIAEIEAPPSDRMAINELQAHLEGARRQAQELMQQNLRFQQQIDEHIKKEDRMEGLLREVQVCVGVGVRVPKPLLPRVLVDVVSIVRLSHMDGLCPCCSASNPARTWITHC